MAWSTYYGQRPNCQPVEQVLPGYLDSAPSQKDVVPGEEKQGTGQEP